MGEEMKDAAQTNEVNALTHSGAAAFPNRREFLGQAGAAAAVVTGALAGPSAAFGQLSNFTGDQQVASAGPNNKRRAIVRGPFGGGQPVSDHPGSGARHQWR